MNKVRIYTKRFFNSSTPNKAIAAMFGVAFIVVVGLLVLGRASLQTAYLKNTRSITIYDDAAPSKIIVTRSNNTATVLKAADITVNPRDHITSTLDVKNHATVGVINITRARHVSVIDGARQIDLFTAAQGNDEIAKVAQLPILSHDETKTTPSTNLSSTGAGLTMTITRAKTVNLSLYGHALTLRTQTTTVRDFLAENKIKLSQDDTTSLPLAVPITDGMNLQIWRNGLQTISNAEAVAFTTQKVNDDTKNVGFDQITTPGQNGQQTCIYQVNMQNGQEVARNQISCVMNVPPVTQVETIGTKISLPAGSHTDWMNEAGIAAGDQGYVNYIFSHESGWRPNASNGTYYGLGQTNLSKLTSSCGATWESDPICQIGVFNSYAVSRYGSWAAAYSAWTTKHWW